MTKGSPSSRPIVFLSDYGLVDEFVGICHSVMARISPRSRIVDLSHAIPPQDVMRGALLLDRSIPFLPADAVVLAVVDPGVGTGRRAVAVRSSRHGRLMVGPDNGVLSLGWSRDGGVAGAVEISSSEVTLEPVSTTFHGRDVFAPAAAHLAAGLTLERLGPGIDPRSLISVSIPEPGVEAGRIDAQVLGIDRFGNLQLAATAEHLARAGLASSSRLEVGTGRDRLEVRRASTFGDVNEGEFAVIEDSSGWLAVVLNRGSAAEVLGVVTDERVTLRAPDGSAGAGPSQPAREVPPS